MRILSSITLTCLFTLSAAGCVAPSDEPSDDVATAATEIDATPAPLCPDEHFDLPIIPRSCRLPDGTPGQRNCEDHVTIHYSVNFSPPPAHGVVCVESSTDTTTSCGACQPILVP
jgi:hypothetical protein